MSLSASMWTSVSGLIAHGNKMNVVGNNISNVSTLGFKGQRMDFQDFVYQSMGTASGMGQVGRGTNIGIIMNDFSQGAHETTTSATDIAIAGEGFFKVKPKAFETEYYTRAGNFTFDKDGFLVNPQGYVLQGWAIDRNMANNNISSQTSNGILGSGTPTDVKLDTFTCQPRHTTNVDIEVTLPSENVSDKSNASGTDPFFALLNQWDATQTPPLGTSKYVAQTTFEVYDEAGKVQKLTIYYDKVEDSVTKGSASENYWEYVITMDPASDVRDFNSVAGAATTSPNVPGNLKGLLGAGTMTFDAAGQMKDMTCFVPQGTPETPGTPGPPVILPTPQVPWWSGASPNAKVDMQKFVAAPISSNGFPMIAPNFSGAAGEANAYKPGNYTSPNEDATDHMIAINMGLKNKKSSWTFPTGLVPALNPTGTGGLMSAADMGTNQLHARGIDGHGELQNQSIKNYGSNYNEKNLKQDGYGYGELRHVSVSSNGVLSGTYTNGVSLPLYQIVLTDFPSTQNLRREGGNLFTETRESGLPVSGAAGTGVFGTTLGSALEQSNVDLSREFVNMITTQRGFQANSKTITTVDTMLEVVISMKR